MTQDQGPFSHPNRLELIDRYFANRKVDPAEAWKDVYRLLLWCDPTTGLAHCYESDKAQPGRPWYARTLAFHDWLSLQLGVPNDVLPDQLDWMFRQVIAQVTAEGTAKRQAHAGKAEAQRALYPSDMPAPGEDPELWTILEPVLRPHLGPDDELTRQVMQQIRAHIGSENKRKNLLGRGFEDVVAGIIARLDGGAPAAFGTQTSIDEIPGFRAVRTGDKTEKVDLWAQPSPARRVMASAKWSVRADREKQMRGDFLTYVTANSVRDPFEFVWITNEFDPARLVANATNTESNRYLLDAVVHVCPAALEVVHQLDRSDLRETPARLKELLNQGRIIGLGGWLAGLR